MLFVFTVMLAVFSVTANAQEKFTFPEYVELVDAPTFPAGYLGWDNTTLSLILKDGRRWEQKSFAHHSLAQSISICTLDGKPFLYADFSKSVSGSKIERWQNLKGEVFFFFDGHWGKFAVTGPLEYMRAEYLAAEVANKLGINRDDMHRMNKLIGD